MELKLRNIRLPGWIVDNAFNASYPAGYRIVKNQLSGQIVNTVHLYNLMRGIRQFRCDSYKIGYVEMERLRVFYVSLTFRFMSNGP